MLFNLRRDPYEKAAEESGMFVRWMGNKMWAFGPLNHIVRKHLASLKAFPTRSAGLTNETDVEAHASQEGGLSQ